MLIIGMTMNKMFFIICIAVVFFIGLFVSKTTDINYTYSVSTKNRNVSEIVTDGFNKLKSWGNNTIRNFGFYRDSINSNQRALFSEDIKNKSIVDNYDINSIKGFLNDTAAFIFRKSVLNIQYNCAQADETAARTKIHFKFMNELTLKLF